MIEKPAAIAANAVKSAKWDEITEGRDFQPADAPILSMLRHWYAVMEQCIEDMDAMDGQLVYENRMEDMKPLPQLDIMKKASAEIRQINKQLGICDEAKPEPKREASIIHVLHQFDYQPECHCSKTLFPSRPRRAGRTLTTP